MLWRISGHQVVVVGRRIGPSGEKTDGYGVDSWSWRSGLRLRTAWSAIANDRNALCRELLSFIPGEPHSEPRRWSRWRPVGPHDGIGFCGGALASAVVTADMASGHRSLAGRRRRRGLFRQPEPAAPAKSSPDHCQRRVSHPIPSEAGLMTAPSSPTSTSRWSASGNPHCAHKNRPSSYFRRVIIQRYDADKWSRRLYLRPTALSKTRGDASTSESEETPAPRWTATAERRWTRFVFFFTNARLVCQGPKNGLLVWLEAPRVNGPLSAPSPPGERPRDRLVRSLTVCDNAPSPRIGSLTWPSSAIGCQCPPDIGRLATECAAVRDRHTTGSG